MSPGDLLLVVLGFGAGVLASQGVVVVGLVVLARMGLRATHPSAAAAPIPTPPAS